MNIHLNLHYKDRIEPLDFEYDRMINAGYVGRDQAEVQRHIQELAKKGIPAPKSTPILIPVFTYELACAQEIEVFGHETSGEAEYVLLIKNEDEVYVALGSDHTDRHLEELDIPRSKQICRNVISRDAWRLGDLIDHWDDIEIRSAVVKDGKRMPYQEGQLGLILSPAQLMQFVRASIGAPLKNIVVFSGTVATVTGDFVFGERFSAELFDAKLGRRLELSYGINAWEALSDF